MENLRMENATVFISARPPVVNPDLFTTARLLLGQCVQFPVSGTTGVASDVYPDIRYRAMRIASFQFGNEPSMRKNTN